jgi:hypothetical protein
MEDFVVVTTLSTLPGNANQGGTQERVITVTVESAVGASASQRFDTSPIPIPIADRTPSTPTRLHISSPTFTESFDGAGVAPRPSTVGEEEEEEEEAISVVPANRIEEAHVAVYVERGTQADVTPPLSRTARSLKQSPVRTRDLSRRIPVVNDDLEIFHNEQASDEFVRAMRPNSEDLTALGHSYDDFIEFSPIAVHRTPTRAAPSPRRSIAPKARTDTELDEFLRVEQEKAKS